MRLIDADELTKQLVDKGWLRNDILNDSVEMIAVKAMIDCAPTINTERHGEWLPVDELYDAFDCSECDAMVHKPCNYCPKCGAKMDLGDNNAKT